MPLNFFKRNKGKPRGCQVTPNVDSILEATSEDTTHERKSSKVIPQSFQENVDIRASLPTTSRLAWSFEDLTSDSEALSYFFQYLEYIHFDHLLKFWLEVKSSREPDQHPPLELSDPPDSSIPLPNHASVHFNHNVVTPPLNQFSEENHTGDDSAPSPCWTAGESPEDIACLESKLDHLLPNTSAALYLKYLSNRHEAMSPTNCTQNGLSIPDQVKYNTLCSIIQNGVRCDTDTLASCQNYVENILKNELYPDYLKSAFHIRYQMNLLTKKQLFLADIIYNEDQQMLFTEFLQSENLEDYLCFLLAVESFGSHSDAASPVESIQEDLLNDALAIHNKYISRESEHQIEFSDEIHREVVDLMCREDGSNSQCFEKARRIVYRYLEDTWLTQFTSSQMFYKHLGELVNLIDLSQFRTKYGPAKTGSDTTSERSLEALSVQSEPPISARNSLLAGANSYRSNNHHSQHRSGAGKENTRISPNVSEADSLWQRPGMTTSSSMRFGHVDAFGQFHSEVSRVRSESSGSFSAFFHTKNTKDDEQLALEVAKKIISDVQRLTTGSADI